MQRHNYQVLWTIKIFLCIFLSLEVYAHGGGVVQSGPLKGCHNDTKKKEFHCHNKSKYNGKRWDSKKDALLEVGKLESSIPSVASTKPPRIYNRNEWGPWKDFDGDCKNTRAEILERDSTDTTKFNPKGCLVLIGKWTDFYSGETFTDASKVEIDHVVPVKHAFDAGGKEWTSEKKAQFYNDEENLVVTSVSMNRSKGANDFTNWMPKDRKRACDYATKWFKIKKKYSLEISEAESENFQLLNCEKIAENVH